MFRLDGKIALVTGCGTLGDAWGNGKAIAAVLARQGASVYGCDLDIDAARQSAAATEAEGGRIQVRQSDVRDEQQVAELVETCVSEYGRIDILVNNVGRSEAGRTCARRAWREAALRRRA